MLAFMVLSAVVLLLLCGINFSAEAEVDDSVGQEVEQPHKAVAVRTADEGSVASLPYVMPEPEIELLESSLVSVEPILAPGPLVELETETLSPALEVSDDGDDADCDAADDVDDESETETETETETVAAMSIPEELWIRDFSTRNLVPLRGRASTAWAMFSFLKEQGWGYDQIMAVMGNIMAECSLWYAPDYGAYYKGACQWEPVRWDRLVSEGFAMNTLDGQLAGMLWELENHYADAYGQFLAAESIDAAVRIFARKYEGGGYMERRLFYADQFDGLFCEYKF